MKLLFTNFQNKLKELSTYKTSNPMKNLKKKLKEEFPFNENVTALIFMKPRSCNTAAVLLTSNLQEQLCNSSILGQPSDTSIYKYQDRSMICHNSYKCKDADREVHIPLPPLPTPLRAFFALKHLKN